MFSSVSAPFCWPTTTIAPALERREAGDDRLVVAEEPIAVQLDEPVGHRGDELERPRPPQVAGQLDAGPGAVIRAVERRAVAGSVRAAAGAVSGRVAARGIAAGQLADAIGQGGQERERAEPAGVAGRLGDDRVAVRTGRCRSRPASSSRSSARGTTRSTKP